MYIRRVKRKCGIRGCRNTDCFAISRAREIGNTVIMCRDCLKEALEAVEALPDGAKTNIAQAKPTEAPPLFFPDVINAHEKTEQPEEKKEVPVKKEVKPKPKKTERKE